MTDSDTPDIGDIEKFDPGLTQRWMGSMRPVLKTYFRSEVHGLDSFPPGGALVVSNHSGGITIGENDSRRSEERKHEAVVTVRLVSKDDDVIWSGTAESLGGKFLGASADVADKIAKRLATDFKAAKKVAAEQHPVETQKELPTASKQQP